MFELSNASIRLKCSRPSSGPGYGRPGGTLFIPFDETELLVQRDPPVLARHADHLLLEAAPRDKHLDAQPFLQRRRRPLRPIRRLGFRSAASSGCACRSAAAPRDGLRAQPVGRFLGASSALSASSAGTRGSDGSHLRRACRRNRLPAARPAAGSPAAAPDCRCNTASHKT